jgi:peptide/nickel transport system ATP-binding protein
MRWTLITVSSDAAPLVLEVCHLTTVIRMRECAIRPVQDLSFSVPAGGAVGIVGESGSGKSLAALSIMRLLPETATIESGRILFEGDDLAALSENRLRALRGRAIGMVFQEPMTALNPLLRVGDQVAESLLLHRICPPHEARDRAIEMLSRVGISDPLRRAADYPHQMSGGMRQRVMIAAALACRPHLLIADEPTTALDVTIQAQILDLLRRLRAELGTATVLITHDLGVVAEFVDSVVVMYAGGVVERADVRALFRSPAHPYTEGLLRAVPRVHTTTRRLRQIPGTVPSPTALPAGCRFHPRCSEARPLCTRHAPPELEITPTQSAACWKHTGFVGPE